MTGMNVASDGTAMAATGYASWLVRIGRMPCPSCDETFAKAMPSD